jgi:hypothetical protein
MFVCFYDCSELSYPLTGVSKADPLPCSSVSSVFDCADAELPVDEVLVEFSAVAGVTPTLGNIKQLLLIL